MSTYSQPYLSIFLSALCLFFCFPSFYFFFIFCCSFLFLFLFYSCFFSSHLPLWPPSSFCFSFTAPLRNPSDWLTVCCVYFGLQGDLGLPGPSGTPGDGSLRSEQTLTIYKGDKVTQQGKARSRSCNASTTHTHTHTRMWWGFFIKVVKRRSTTQQAAGCLLLQIKS